MFSGITRLALVLTLLTISPASANMVNSFMQFPAAAGAGPFDMDDFSYASKSCDVDAVLTTSIVTEGRWNDAGDKIYIIDIGADTIEALDLSTAWDISTCSDASEVLDISAHFPQAQGLDWNNDGTILAVTGNNQDDIEFWTCSTAYLATDANCTHQAADRIAVNTFENNPRTFAWCGTGLSGTLMGSQGDSFDQFDCSTAYDGSTCSHTDVTNPSTNTPEGVDFPAAQTVAWVSSSTDTAYSADLTADCDMSTYSSASGTLSVASQTTAPTSLDIGNSNTVMMICGQINDTCFQYE